MDFLSVAFFKTPQGRISQSLAEWATLFGCDEATAKTVLEAIKKHEVGDVVTERNGDITVVNRRIFREWEEKHAGAIRQARFRENGGGDPEKWTALRAVVLVRDGKICSYCSRKAITVDHVIPKSKGGEHDPTNLVACCKRCNSIKGNRTPVQAGMRFVAAFDFSILNEKALKAAGIGVSEQEFVSNGKVTLYSSSSTSSSTSTSDLNRLIATCVREHSDADARLIEIAVIETMLRRKGSANEHKPIKSARYFEEEIKTMLVNGGKLGDNAIDALLKRRREQINGNQNL